MLASSSTIGNSNSCWPRGPPSGIKLSCTRKHQAPRSHQQWPSAMRTGHDTRQHSATSYATHETSSIRKGGLVQYQVPHIAVHEVLQNPHVHSMPSEDVVATCCWRTALVPVQSCCTSLASALEASTAAPSAATAHRTPISTRNLRRTHEQRTSNTRRVVESSQQRGSQCFTQRRPGTYRRRCTQ